MVRGSGAALVRAVAETGLALVEVSEVHGLRNKGRNSLGLRRPALTRAADVRVNAVLPSRQQSTLSCLLVIGLHIPCSLFPTAGKDISP